MPMDQPHRETSQPEQPTPDVDLLRRLLVTRTLDFERSLRNIRFPDARDQILFDSILYHGVQALLTSYLDPRQPPREQSVNREPSVEPESPVQPEPGIKHEPNFERGPAIKHEIAITRGPNVERGSAIKRKTGIDHEPGMESEPSVEGEPNVEQGPNVEREPIGQCEPVVKSEPRGSTHEPGHLQFHLQLEMTPPSKSNTPLGRMENPVLFVCDIQEAFRRVIHEYPKVISTAQKMIKASSILSIPIYATTQSAARLGPLCAEIFPPPAAPNFQIDKTTFSMIVPELRARMVSDSSHRYQVAIIGIEAHVCVSQTALDLLADGHSVCILADGVSSSHRAQSRIALDRLARAGAVITTSEAWLYEYMGDAKHDRFREIKDLVKDSRTSTNEALDALCML